METEWYYADGDVQKGPFSLAVLVRQGIRPETLVWREGMSDWKRADSVPEVRAALAGAAQPQPANPAQAVQPQPTYAAQPSPQPTYPQPQGYPQPTYAPAAYGQAHSPYGAPLSYGGYGASQQPNGMAITSLILGIVSIPMTFGYCIGTPCAIIAVILGHIARGKARRGEAGGDGMALGGLITGYISIGIALAGLVLLLIVFLAAASSGPSGSQSNGW